MRPLPRDGETVGTCRVGRVRRPRFPFPLLLGAAPAPAVTLHGRPVAFALTGAKADERNVLSACSTTIQSGRRLPWQKLTADKNDYGAASKAPRRRRR